MINSILFILLSTLSYWLYTSRVVPAEVRQNAADILANGSQDNLRAGYHQRRAWARVWPALGCCVVPALPLSLGGGIGGGVLAFLANAALLGGYFARYFTPQLNLALGLAYKDEYYASPDSASWPDAAAWKQVRALPALYLSDKEQREGSSYVMQRILTNTWLYCRIAAALLALGAVAVASF